MNTVQQTSRRFTRFQNQVMALCLAGACMYLLLYAGLLDWIAELF